MMNALNICISTAEIRKYMDWAGVKNTFTLRQFLRIQEKRILEQRVRLRLVEAFQVYEQCGNVDDSFEDIRNAMEEAQVDISVGTIGNLAREALESNGEFKRTEEFIRVITNKVE